MVRDLKAEIEEIRGLLKDRDRAGGDMVQALQRARRRLPRRIYRQGLVLARALPLLEHPKLALTLDEAALLRSAREVKAHLKAIDIGDRRKGRMLEILASAAFSLIAVFVLLIVVLRWRGFV